MLKSQNTAQDHGLKCSRGGFDNAHYSAGVIMQMQPGGVGPMALMLGHD
jgi:hypothetical protein